MEDKKSKESCFDEPLGFQKTTPCSPNCKNENAKQPKKSSSEGMEEYFKMMDAMEQDLEEKYGKIDFKH